MASEPHLGPSRPAVRGDRPSSLGPSADKHRARPPFRAQGPCFPAHIQLQCLCEEAAIQAPPPHPLPEATGSTDSVPPPLSLQPGTQQALHKGCSELTWCVVVDWPRDPGLLLAPELLAQ